MKYKEMENKIVLEDFDSFDIGQTLECGQCFRFNKLSEGEYVIIACSRVLHIKQSEHSIEFYPCDKKDFDDIWRVYFDLDRDYGKIKNILAQIDDVLKKAVDFAPGIRILNQEPWECLISFIISQNNRIPMIKQVIRNISEKYGTSFEDYFLFPTLEQIKDISQEELMSCKTGFRAKYIIDAVKNVKSGNVDFEKLKNVSTENAREKLMEIKGVGEKVSDCVLLFSMGRRDVFPTDVWVKRVMEHFYFEGKDTKIKDIHSFAEDKFGELSGFAQQYLFHYARQLKIGTK